MNINSIELSPEISKYHDFVAFTSTFYKDDVEWKVRSEAFFEMIENAQKLGIRVVVGDGWSGSEFIERLQKYSNITYVVSGRWWENPDLTMAGERRFTWKKAMEAFPDATNFLWLEPEKAELMKMENIDAILQPLRDGFADMVVPSRKSKETLPPQQRAAENRANRRASHILKRSSMAPLHDFRSASKYSIEDWIWSWVYHTYDRIYKDNHTWVQYDSSLNVDILKTNAQYDLWFGPKAFARKSMDEDFLSYHWAKWDGIITSVLAGKMRWKNVVDVPVDFSYPPKQTELETDPVQGLKYQKLRRSQYRYIIKTIRDMVKHISHPESIMKKVQDSIASGNFDALVRLINSFPLSFAHQDHRRLIQEYNGDNFSVQRFTVFDNSVWLGNHFHTKWDQNISEIFLIEAGKWTLILQNLDASWVPFWDKEIVQIQKGDTIVIPPFQAHTFFLDIGSIMRWFRPYPFDTDDMDMNPHKLELPII